MKVLKFIALALVALVVVAGAAFGIVYTKIESKRASKIEVAVAPIAIPTDEASINEGKRIAQVKGCADCHGADFGGKVFIDEPPIGHIAGSNITSAKGSRVAQYSDADWVRSIRFGLDPSGRPLVAMPAGDFHGMSNEDLGRMIAYLKSVPPVDRESERITVGPVARVLYSLGQLPLLFPFEEVDLKAQPIDKVVAEKSAEYGKYVAQGCTGCHGPGYSGGAIPGVPPSWPKAANLTPSGRVSGWTLADFKKALQEGITPDGRQMDPQFMPWKAMQAMNETEIEAVFAFLKTVPARAAGTR